MSDIAERVKKIVIDHLGVDADKVVEGASFIDDLGADSLDTVELVMAFEEEFGVEIPDDAAEFDPHGRRCCEVHRKGSGLISTERHKERALRPAQVRFPGPFLLQMRQLVSAVRCAKFDLA